MKINEYKTPLIKFKLHNPSEQNYTLSVGNRTFKFNKANRDTFEKFLREFQFITDQKPVTKTPNDYKSLLSDIHNGKKPCAYLYKNRADRMYKYLRKKGNPYYKESTISADILPSVKITTEPKDKKKQVLFGGMYKLTESLFDCDSPENVKSLFIKKSS